MATPPRGADGHGRGSSIGGATGRGPAGAGRPLQLVKLNMAERRVELDEGVLEEMTRRLAEFSGARVAVISVIGAFRTGKSFLLDLFLRYLRHDDVDLGGAEHWPPRGQGATCRPPRWLTAWGDAIRNEEGFKFAGGMDVCTEGIWVWSEPFLRRVEGRDVVLLLLDTQGAWDPIMTEEQSATIFGLTSLLSSKQIYNINMQIQRDRVENLAYFMRFAQAALRASDAAGVQTGDLDRPFQSLDFLVRDWANFEDEWSVEQCRAQMREHLDRHLNPNRVTEGTTAEALYSMFGQINCFCLPHPGTKIQKSAWTGQISDIDVDFLRFVDIYIRETFSQGLQPKTVLGAELTTNTFPHVLRHFVVAFHNAAPSAVPFCQAMTNFMVLAAKNSAMTTYSDRMDVAFGAAPEGLELDAFRTLHETTLGEVERSFMHTPIIGADAARYEAWASTQEALQIACHRYESENLRRHDRVLARFASVALLGVALFAIDKFSDVTCDWWSQTCCNVSRILLTSYAMISGYIVWQSKRLVDRRGINSLGNACAELCKEMFRLLCVYGELVSDLGSGGLLQLPWAFARRFLGR